MHKGRVGWRTASERRIGQRGGQGGVTGHSRFWRLGSRAEPETVVRSSESRSRLRFRVLEEGMLSSGLGAVSDRLVCRICGTASLIGFFSSTAFACCSRSTLLAASSPGFGVSWSSSSSGEVPYDWVSTEDAILASSDVPYFTIVFNDR